MRNRGREIYVDKESLKQRALYLIVERLARIQKHTKEGRYGEQSKQKVSVKQRKSSLR
jgi:hypothetical protein